MDNFYKAQKAYREALKRINVKENEKIVLECKNVYWCSHFAANIPEADIKAHENVILQLKDPGCSIVFARDVLGANIEEHFKVVVNSGIKIWLDNFIEVVNYKNTKVEEWLLYI